MTKDKIIKFLNNRCTDAELDEIIQWANSEAFSEESLAWGLSHWSVSPKEENTGDNQRFSAIFDKIQERIAVESRMRDNRKSGRQLFLSRLTRAAALLLLPAIAWLCYTLIEISAIKRDAVRLANFPVDSLEVISPVGSRTVVQLSDGSVVHLNAGSRLKYPYTFTGNTREVALMGEGYFEVAHNAERPFVVKAGGLNVRALGTTFNVLAYPDIDAVETTLVEGKVVLERADATAGTAPIEDMRPGQHIAYNVT